MEQKHVDINTFQGVGLNLMKGRFTEMHGKYGIVFLNFQMLPRRCFSSSEWTFLNKKRGNDANLIRINRFKLVLLLTGCQYHS